MYRGISRSSVLTRASPKKFRCNSEVSRTTYRRSSSVIALDINCGLNTPIGTIKATAKDLSHRRKN